MSLFSRRAGACVLLVWLAVAWGGRPHRAAAAAAPPVVPATRVAVFHPAGSSGVAVAGACEMGESIAAERIDAWRCAVGNAIYDPCFSAAPRATTVICGATPARPIGIRVRLAGPLPAHGAVSGARPWFLVLGDGSTCSFLTGATFEVGGQRANYGCSDRDYVIGDPARGRVWLAAKARLSGKVGAAGPIPSRIWKVSVADAWE